MERCRVNDDSTSNTRCLQDNIRLNGAYMQILQFADCTGRRFTLKNRMVGPVDDFDP